MATLEERVAYLEGKVEEHSRAFPDLRDDISRLGQRFETRFTALEQRVDNLADRIDRRFEGVDRRIDALDDKVSRQFIWTVGIQITTLIAVLGAVLGAVVLVRG